MNNIFVFCLCFLVQQSFAQTLTIRDADTRHPIEMVTLYSSKPVVSAFTDAKGNVDLSQFVDADTIYFRLIGYKPVQKTLPEIQRMNYILLMNPTNFSLQEITISVSRWEQEKHDLPNKISSIKPEEIYLQNPQTAADILTISNEVYIQKSQLGGGSPMIRGFATNRVLLVVDGVRMNNAIFRSGNLQNVISLDPFTIQSSEIVFGPGSVIYGSDAIGGVMSFYTLSPSFSSTEKPLVKGSVFTRYSSANSELTGHLDLNVGFKKWGSSTSISYSNFENLKMGKHGPDEYLRPTYAVRINGVDTMLINSDPEIQIPTGYNQVNLMQKLRFVPTHNWKIDYGFHYSTTSDFPRYDRHILYRNGLQRSAEWYYGSQTWMMNSLGILNSSETSFYNQVKLTLSYQHFEESRHDRDFGDVIRYNRYEEVDAFGANLDFEKKISKKHSIFYGVEGILNEVGSTGIDTNIATQSESPGPTRYPDGSTWQSYAGYINYLVRTSKLLTIQTGLRYNHILLKSQFDTAFYPFPFSEANINAGAVTGSAGLAWSPLSSWQFNANFSSGFRSPNVDDVGKVFDSEPGSVILPNPDLKPEYAYNFELGITHIFGDLAKLDATGYYTILKDAMVRRNYRLNGQDSILYDGELSQVLSIQNSAKAFVYGIQTGVEVKLPAGFSLTSNINYQAGEEELDDESTTPLRHAAPLFGSTHILWTRGKLKADLYSFYNGRIAFKNLAPEEQNKSYLYAIDGNGNPYSPAWYTLNFKFLYHATNFITLNLGLENITNQRYRPYSSGIAAPGTNFIISTRFTF